MGDVHVHKIINFHFYNDLFHCRDGRISILLSSSCSGEVDESSFYISPYELNANSISDIKTFKPLGSIEQPSRLFLYWPKTFLHILWSFRLDIRLRFSYIQLIPKRVLIKSRPLKVLCRCLKKRKEVDDADAD